MKSKYALAVVMISFGLLACSQPLNQREKGAIAGGAIGTGLGAIVGHAVGSTGAGMAIGGGAGLLTGGLIGDSLDSQDQATKAQEEKLRRQDQELRRQRRELDELKKQQAGS